MPDRLFEWRAKDALFFLYTAIDIRTAVSFCSYWRPEPHRAKYHTQAMRMFALGCVLTFFVLW